MTACTFSLKQTLCECLWTSGNDNMPVSNQLSNDGVRQSAQGPQRISGMAGILIKTSEWLSVPMLECIVIKKCMHPGWSSPSLETSFEEFLHISGHTHPRPAGLFLHQKNLCYSQNGISRHFPTCISPALYFSALCQETPFLFL